MKKNRIENIPSLPLPTNSEKGKHGIINEMVDNLLQLTVYHKNSEEPYADIFIDTENKDWLSKIYKKDGIRYSEAMLINLIRFLCWWNSDTFFVSNEKLLFTLFKTDDTGKYNSLYYLQNWQQCILDKRNDLKLAKKFAKWDEELKIFAWEVPNAFKEYMRKEADGKFFMFFDNKDSKTGYCSRCRKEVPLMKAPKQLDKYKCPSCRKTTIFKRKSAITTLSIDYYNGAYIRKVNGLITIRIFSGSQSYRGCSFDSPQVNLNENIRIILNKDGSLSYYWYGMYNKRICRWNKQTQKECLWTMVNYYYDYNNIRNVYTKNLSGILKFSGWNCWKKKPCDLSKYLVIENQSKGLIEKLAKIGLFDIAKYFMSKGETTFRNSINESGKNLGQILKLDNARLKRLIKNGSVEFYNWLLIEKENNSYIIDDVLEDFSSHGITANEMKYLPPQMSFEQINNYIKKNVTRYEETYEQIFSTWKDYLNMAQRNGWDITSSMIYKPKNLMDMHAKAILFRDGDSIEEEVKILEEKWPEVNKNLSLLKKFEYTEDEFSIIVPQSIKDIVCEGHCLQHCIHRCDFYFDRITNRESYIFFLRRTENKDISWYTLEVEQNGNILQKRTTGDTQRSDLDSAIPFLKRFQKVFLERMTEEEVKLGVIAEEKRIARYSELRENKAKIARGKFANQLLADILEADLIVA